ncbi:alanine/glycine:cation symporter family protein [Candidatus Palauibacter sp.]|uniref:alanine/glycine:cation symporter family protein n=1 Tax=Candidatus Palauibacter sp. TaxID=3101350 RepID=UPI003B51D366
MVQALETIQAWVWGVPLIILLLMTGLVYTLLLRGLQFRRLWHALWLALVKRREPDGEGDISHFQALMTALAATVGTGNIVGVATAIGAGGPGALFWMWVTGLLGMATKYAEAVLGVRYRETDARGEKAGGPMYYLEHGLGRGGLGRVLAIAFAAFATLAAFGIGNGVQSQAVADAMNESFGIPHWIVGLVTAAAVGFVIIGGIRSIGRVASVIVPTMIVLYIGVAGLVLISNAAEIPAAFGLVFEHAFGGRAVAGGALGYTVLQAMRFGVARGIFSNESGLGTGAIAAAAAQTREPVRQALVSMTQTFIDTIVVCTLTGLAILTTGAWSSGAEGANMTQLAFDTSLLAGAGDIIVALGLATFAFSTMLGWSYYGERSLAYLFGARAIPPYRLAFVAVVGLAAVVELDVVWLVSDILNGLMAAPNLVGLLLLSGVVRRETRSYFGRV